MPRELYTGRARSVSGADGQPCRKISSSPRDDLFDFILMTHDVVWQHSCTAAKYVKLLVQWECPVHTTLGKWNTTPFYTLDCAFRDLASVLNSASAEESHAFTKDPPFQSIHIHNSTLTTMVLLLRTSGFAPLHILPACQLQFQFFH